GPAKDPGRPPLRRRRADLLGRAQRGQPAWGPRAVPAGSDGPGVRARGRAAEGRSDGRRRGDAVRLPPRGAHVLSVHSAIGRAWSPPATVPAEETPPEPESPRPA